MRVNLDFDEIKKRKADSRGRITLGKEYADQEVEVAVLSDQRKKLEGYERIAKLMENKPEKLIEVMEKELRDED